VTVVDELAELLVDVVALLVVVLLKDVAVAVELAEVLLEEVLLADVLVAEELLVMVMVAVEPVVELVALIELLSVRVDSDEVVLVLDIEVTVEEPVVLEPVVVVEVAVLDAEVVVREVVEEWVPVEVVVVFVAVRPVPPPQTQQTSLATLPKPAEPSQSPLNEKMRA